jgi:hypothetical protein
MQFISKGFKNFGFSLSGSISCFSFFLSLSFSLHFPRIYLPIGREYDQYQYQYQDQDQYQGPKIYRTSSVGQKLRIQMSELCDLKEKQINITT